MGYYYSTKLKFIPLGGKVYIMKAKNIKKLVALLSISTMLVSLTACGSKLEEVTLNTETELANAPADQEEGNTIVEKPEAQPANEASGEGEAEEAEGGDTGAVDTASGDTATGDSNTSSSDTPTADAPATSSSSKSDPVVYGTLSFSTYDYYGNAVSLSDYSGASLIMLNMWEPWCGPCVGELEALEKLYETYKDQGFVILGAFRSEGYEDYIDYYISEYGLTYPLIWRESNIDALSTGSVPTTYFLDGNGNIISESYIGSREYSSWESIIKTYL